MTEKDHEVQHDEWRELSMPGDVREAQIEGLRAMVAADGRQRGRWRVAVFAAAACAGLIALGATGWALTHAGSPSVTVHCALNGRDAAHTVSDDLGMSKAQAFSLCGVDDDKAFNAYSPVACRDADGQIWVWRDAEHATCPTGMTPLN